MDSTWKFVVCARGYVAETGCVRLTDVLSQDDANDKETGNYDTIQV